MVQGSGFQHSVDNLANLGILNFDADAFLKGTAPRYVGAPEPKLQLPLDRPLGRSPYAPNMFLNPYGFYPGMGANLSQPSVDAFVSNSHHSTKLPKEGIIAALLGGVGILSLAKIAGTKANPKQLKLPSPEHFAKGNPAIADPTFGQKAKRIAGEAWGKVKAAPKWAKLGVGIMAGITALYVISNLSQSNGHSKTANSYH